MKLSEKISIPKYSLSEELISAISHGIGSLFGVAALVLCVVFSAIHKSPIAVVSSAIYGSTLIILYTMSTLYHALKINNAKRVFRIIDHCSIYLLIAGTYTPFTLVSLNGWLGWTLFGVIWGFAILGIVLNSIDMKKFKVISVISYVAMGWMIVLAIKPMSATIDPTGLMYLIVGGIVYTIGAILYVIGKKVKYMHSLFHFFVLAGSILHFFAILFYVI